MFLLGRASRFYWIGAMGSEIARSNVLETLFGKDCFMRQIVVAYMVCGQDAVDSPSPCAV